MNILVLAKDYPPTIGGVENYSYHIAEGLSKSHDVAVITFEGDGSQNSWKDSADVTRLKTVFKNEIFKAYKLISYLLSFLKHNNIDLVYATTWKVAIPFAFLKYFFNSKFIIVCHGAEITRHKHKKLLMRLMDWTLNKANRIFAVSEFTKNKILEYSSIKSDKIYVIPNGIDLSKLNIINKERARNKIGLNSHVFTILTVSRIDERKGHQYVLQALWKLINKGIDMHYLIVGNGPAKNELLKLVHQLGISEYVTFTGFVSNTDLNLYYSAADIFVMVNTMVDDTDFEGFGLVFAEAGYYNLPLIGGNNAGPKEVIIEGKSGFLVDENAQEIAKKIEAFCTNTELVETMGYHAKYLTNHEFSLKKLISRINSNFGTLDNNY